MIQAPTNTMCMPYKLIVILNKVVTQCLLFETNIVLTALRIKVDHSPPGFQNVEILKLFCNKILMKNKHNVVPVACMNVGAYEQSPSTVIK